MSYPDESGLDTFKESSHLVFKRDESDSITRLLYVIEATYILAILFETDHIQNLSIRPWNQAPVMICKIVMASIHFSLISSKFNEIMELLEVAIIAADFMFKELDIEPIREHIEMIHIVLCI